MELIDAWTKPQGDIGKSRCANTRTLRENVPSAFHLYVADCYVYILEGKETLEKNVNPPYCLSHQAESMAI